MSQYPASGTWAVLDGVTYRATPVSRDGTVELTRKGEEPPPNPRFRRDEEWNLWTLTLPPAECDELYSVASRVRYHGHVCQVIAIDADGKTLLYYLEGDRGVAESLGFEQTDPGTHSKIVDVHELYDYYEERRDLLFNTWRERTFPRPEDRRE
jgi:hypothetical protein